MTNSKPIEPLQMSSLFVAFLGFITPFSLVLGLTPMSSSRGSRGFDPVRQTSNQ